MVYLKGESSTAWHCSIYDKPNNSSNVLLGLCCRVCCMYLKYGSKLKGWKDTMWIIALERVNYGKTYDTCQKYLFRVVIKKSFSHHPSRLFCPYLRVFYPPTRFFPSHPVIPTWLKFFIFSFFPRSLKSNKTKDKTYYLLYSFFIFLSKPMNPSWPNN